MNFILTDVEWLHIVINHMATDHNSVKTGRLQSRTRMDIQRQQICLSYCFKCSLLMLKAQLCRNLSMVFSSHMPSQYQLSTSSDVLENVALFSMSQRLHQPSEGSVISTIYHFFQWK